MPERSLVWVGAVLDDLRAFPADARRIAGYQLRRLQSGLLPTDWKPMQAVGPGVQEIRVHTEAEYRVIYVAKYAEAVYVLHAFEKRSRATRSADLDLVRRRWSYVKRMRSLVRETSTSARTRRASANVFRDLGFEGREARHLEIRSELMIALSSLIESQKLTQSRAAQLLGVSQPRISDLWRGKIDRFSIDALVEMLQRAGATVRVTVKRARRVA